MKKNKISDITQEITAGLKKHSPEIFTGIGIGCMITGTILAVRATPKALDIIKKEKPDDKKETVLLTWKCYVPTIASLVTGAGFIIGASSLNLKRNAALGTLYALSESTLSTYKSKVIETIGEKKEEAIRDEIAKEQILLTPPNDDLLIRTLKGDTLCYDGITGRYFTSDIESIRKTVNEVNKKLYQEDYIALNTWYSMLGLPQIVPLGDFIGWTTAKGDGLLDIEFSSTIAENGKPAIVLNYNVNPVFDYDRAIF